MSILPWRWLVLAIAPAVWFDAACAAERPVTFTNMSPEAITAITARDKQTADAQSISLLSASLTTGDTTPASVGLPEDVCVVEITISFASGQSKFLPDTDLCQTDQIAIE